MITAQDRREAIRRAENAIEDLNRHPDTKKGQHEAAAIQRNIVHTWHDAYDVWDAVAGLEAIVTTIYAGIPAHRQ